LGQGLIPLDAVYSQDSVRMCAKAKREEEILCARNNKIAFSASSCYLSGQGQ